MVPVLVGRLVTLQRQISLRTGYRGDGWRVRGWSTSMRTNAARSKRGAFEDRQRMEGKVPGESRQGRKENGKCDSMGWRAEK